MRSGKRLLGILMLSVLVPVAYAFAQTQGASKAAPAATQHVVVHLSRFGDNLHAATMALELASGLQKKGAKVTLLLDLEGVRLADSRTPADLGFGHGETLEARFKHFTEAGGSVVVCPHCAAIAGITPSGLRPGAAIAKEGEVAQLVMDANKVINY